MSTSYSIDEILSLSDDKYTAYLATLLEEEEEDFVHRMDELDDDLLKAIDRHPANVERICRINSIFYSSLEQDDIRSFLLAYNFNTLMLAAINLNDISRSKSVFIEGITFCLENNELMAGKSISKNVMRLFSSNQIPLDEVPYFLSQIKKFYQALDEQKEAISALCAAALYFADASAFQSSYRSLHDAQEIAISQNLPDSQILVLETQGQVALCEGDLDCAESEFQKCFTLYDFIGRTPPIRLHANAALVKLRREDYVGAKEIYRELLDSHTEPENAAQASQIKINLLVCYRELGDTEAINDMLSQIDADLEHWDIEVRIEARLIQSKTLFQIERVLEGTVYLKKACNEIQHVIDQYHRLHYRRGVREKYMNRIKYLLMNIEQSGSYSVALHVFMFCASNALLDWFSVLAWSDQISQTTTVPSFVKEKLSVKIEELIGFGTPFMMGFREKYDDPFDFTNDVTVKESHEQIPSALDFSLPWREFNDLTSHICQTYSCPSPFARASIQNCFDIVRRRLLAGSTFLFTFVTNAGCGFVLFAEDIYVKADISTEDVLNFYMALYRYQRGDANRNCFAADLYKMEKCIEPAMVKIVEILISRSSSELIHIPDHLTEGLPILSGIISNERLRLRINELKFVFRRCPAISEEAMPLCDSGPSLFVVNSKDGLELAASEKAIIRKTFAEQDCIEVDLQRERIDFSKPPANSATLLHFATHGVPANAFSDPFFVSSSTDIAANGIWLESVQRVAHDLKFSLVILNGCNTGTTSNSNYFKTYSTNENVGISAAFLLNRRCTVIATQWNEPEIVGYIFISLFYDRLTKLKTSAGAFIAALVDLHDLTKEAAVSLLENISDIAARKKRCEALQQSTSPYPFRNAFSLGMFQYHSLLAIEGATPAF